MSPARELCAAAGLTVDEAARLSGICRRHFEDICRRGAPLRSRRRNRTIPRMAKVLGVPEQVFCCGLKSYRIAQGAAATRPTGSGAANTVPHKPSPKSSVLRFID